MKKFKRIIAAILLFCMIVTIIPPVQKVSAAENTTYQLATEANLQQAQRLFTDVRSWLEPQQGGAE